MSTFGQPGFTKYVLDAWNCFTKVHDFAFGSIEGDVPLLGPLIHGCEL